MEKTEVFKDYKILSLNLMWEAMDVNNARKTERERPKNYPKDCIETERENTVCLENVSKFVDDHQPYDFVGFQEATNWDIIKKLSTTLDNMGFVQHGRLEKMVTYFDKNKFTLENITIEGGNRVENGQIRGRLFQILFFEQRICVINVHAGHVGDIYKFDEHLKDVLNLDIYKEKEAIYMEKFKTYNIIMFGDFNNDLADGNKYKDPEEKGFHVFKGFFEDVPEGRELFGISKQNTCCDIRVTGDPHGFKFIADHILSSTPNVTTTIFHVPKMSDHTPIIATIQFLVGGKYDFFHKYMKYKNKYLTLRRNERTNFNNK